MTPMPLLSRYPHDTVVMPGVGRVHSHTVGSPAQPEGLDHYFLPEGSSKPVAGHVRFSVCLQADGQVGWRFVEAAGPQARSRPLSAPRLTETTQVDFPMEVVARMRQRSETLDEWDPVAWVFSVRAAVATERRAMAHEREQWTHARRYLSRLLNDPQEPTRIFVDANTGHRTATSAERAQQRAQWQQRCEQAQALTDAFDQRQGARAALLTAMHQTLQAWCTHPGSPKPPPRAFLREHLRGR